MQNDLISRSAVMEMLTNIELSYTVIPITEVKLQLKDIPIAYSVEKVDQQILDYFKEQIDKKPDGWDIVDFSCDVRNIIRSGGKE